MVLDQCCPVMLPGRSSTVHLSVQTGERKMFGPLSDFLLVSIGLDEIIVSQYCTYSQVESRFNTQGGGPCSAIGS